MSGDGPHRAMLRVLNDARPDAAVSVLSDVLIQQFGAKDVRVLLANYQFTALRPMLTPDERVLLLIAHHGGNELDDDATVACLDWNGPGHSEELTLTDPINLVPQHPATPPRSTACSRPPRTTPTLWPDPEQSRPLACSSTPAVLTTNTSMSTPAQGLRITAGLR